MGLRSGLWLLLASIATAQIVAPSNGSELGDPAGTPRFLVGSAGSVQFPTFALAALGSYATISRQVFVNIGFSGPLIYTDASNANTIRSADFSLVSCDPEHYEGGNIDAGGILRIISQQQSNWMNQKASVIFYSTRSDHCNVTDFNGLPTINGVFTMQDPIAAQRLQDMNFTRASNAQATLYPDRSTFINGVGSSQQTTAIAMIILYSITGCVTALFVAVIITGAIRAHRHPERYGPRNVPGRPRQSRAKGIARAMLETLPIVKFGDHHDEPKDKPPTGDIELANNTTTDTTTNKATADKSATITTAAVGTKPTSVASSSKGEAESGSKPDGSDEAGTLGCSICTEDFQKGEEVRVLPCNHKFHPECVDPWLLNVSGTCPLCRISLAPESEQAEAGATAEGDMPPPLAENVPAGDRRSQALHNLMAMAYGSREERISALRRYRTDRRNRSLAQNNENPEETVGRARRFREAFRIRTRRHDPARHDPLEAAAQRQDPGLEAMSGPMRL